MIMNSKSLKCGGHDAILTFVWRDWGKP